MQHEQTERKSLQIINLSLIHLHYHKQVHTFAMSTPVKFLTRSGTRCTILKTSSVNFSAPIVPLPLETIVIFFA